MEQTPDVPQPRASEGHQLGYEYRARFPDLRLYAGGEGGSVYLADGDDGYFVVIDEGSMADFLNEGDPVIFTHAFDTAAQRSAYCAARFARLSRDRATVRMSHTGRPVPGDQPFPELLGRFKAHALASPFRSTVPLLACWHSVDLALSRLTDALGEDLSGSVLLSFEHCVPVQRGIGASSQTDLVVETPTHVVAIEAKYTEPGYETVAKWLGGAKTEDRRENRRLVLQGWLDLINRATGASLTAEQVAECTYQLIHRTASACHQPDRHWRAVVYQCFHDDESPDREEYLGQLRRLKNLIDPQAGLHFYRLTCRVRPTPRYEELRDRWRAGVRDLSAEIRAGLRDDYLLRCEEWLAVKA